MVFFKDKVCVWIFNLFVKEEIREDGGEEGRIYIDF